MKANSIQQIQFEYFGFFFLSTLVIIISALAICISSRKKKSLTNDSINNDRKEIVERKNPPPPIYDIVDPVLINASIDFESVVIKSDSEIIIESHVHSEINSNYNSESTEALETSCSGNSMYSTIKNVPPKVEIAYAVVPLHESADKYGVVNGDLVRKHDETKLNTNKSDQLYVTKYYEKVPVLEKTENSGNSSYYASVSEKPKIEIKNEVQENSAGSSFYASCGPNLLTGNAASLDNIANLNKKEDFLQRFSLPDSHHNLGLLPDSHHNEHLLILSDTHVDIPKKLKNKESNSPSKEQKVTHSPKVARFSRVFRLSKKSHHFIEENIGNHGNQPYHDVNLKRHSGELDGESSQYSEKMLDFSIHQNQDHSLPPPPPSVDRLKHITEKKTRAKSNSNSISIVLQEVPMRCREHLTNLSPKLPRHFVNNDIQDDDKYSKVDENMKTDKYSKIDGNMKTDKYSKVDGNMKTEKYSKVDENMETDKYSKVDENMKTLVKKGINFEILPTTNHITENADEKSNLDDHMQFPDSFLVFDNYISETPFCNFSLNNSEEDKKLDEEKLKTLLLYAVVDKSKKTKPKELVPGTLESKEMNSSASSGINDRFSICSDESAHSDFIIGSAKDTSLIDSSYISYSATVTSLPSEFSDPDFKNLGESLIY